MSIVKAHDVTHVRFAAPDLNVMKGFLEDFGMAPVEQDGSLLVMRGHGAAPFVHATAKGPPAFVAFGLQVRSRDDLAALAAHDGVAIEPFDMPGGGQVVRLTDPDGFVVEAVWGQTPAVPLVAPDPGAWNEKGDNRRMAQFRRIDKGPSHVMRLGHVVLAVTDFRASEAWYKDRFGFITSDEIQPAPGIGIGAFMRADRGDLPCDHHTLFLFQHPAGPGFMHAAFEVVDLDDLMAGRDHLLARGHTPNWGIGRHILGSQIFDYWSDPWGHEVEHWTDGDQLRASDGSAVAPLEHLLSVQWGMPFPAPPQGGGA